MNYEIKSREVVQALVPALRNKPDLECQRTIIKSFPFHHSNIVAWRAYFLAVYEITGRLMGGIAKPAAKGKQKEVVNATGV